MVLAQVVRGYEWYNPDGLKTAAGKEFYFAIFDHWLISDDSNQDFGYFHISSEKSNTVTIQSGDKILGQVNIAPNSIQTIGFYKSQITTNKPIHITSTEPCYVNVWVHSALNHYYSETCTAASAILPVHLLGTNYVLQGIEGAGPIDYSHNVSAVPILCTSKFCVVGIAENTTIKVKAANNTKLYQKQSGKSFSEQSFSLSQGEVLYFNLNTLTPDISGTVVSADKPIAVFQGNDLTQLPTEKSPFNGVWEQARPVSSWGTEFIIPKSGLFMKNTVKITASEDNTEVYLVEGTRRQRLTTINAGETYERLIISEIPELAVHHLQTTKPVCCYIYSGSEKTNGAEGPEMAEIIPMDSAATEARWAINFTTNDGPYTSRLIITTRTDNMEYVKLNGQKLSIPMYDGQTRYDCDGYSTWEIPIEPASSGKIIADEGSFSAYIVHKSSKNSVALFNIGLPDPTPVDVQITITSPDSVCPNDPYTFTADIPEVLYQVNTPLNYQWMYKSPEYPTEWRKVSGGNVRDLQIQSFKAHHVGWYKLIVAYAGHLDDPDNRFESNELFVTFKKCEPDLCIDGNLLYRDDFGGNSPSDPRVRTTPVPGMSYQQLKTDRFGSMGQGKYLVTKMGYCNGDTAALRRQYGYLPNWGSQWILQDDHTYPGDYSRGYFVEIDGAGGETPFYTTIIHDLCPGTQLVFSAYVVNVHFYEQVQKFYRQNYRYVYPRMKFVLKNPDTGDILAQQSTGDIQPDVTKAWNIFLRESAEWQHVGLNFTVPVGVESVQMYIYNDTQNGTGNDFAMDDIEIRLCMPSVTVSGDDEVCQGAATTLTAGFVNDGTLVEPLEYKWWHSTDSLTWTELSATSAALSISSVQDADTGWYKVAVSGAGNIESVNCRALSEPFHMAVKECSMEETLCMDGVLLFREDFGGNKPEDPKISTTPVPGMSYAQVTTDTYGSMGAGKYLVTKQGYCNGNGTSQWHLQDDHTHFGDLTRGYLLEIDGIAGSSAFYQTTIDHLCEGIELTFSAYVANVMTWGMYMGRPGMYAYPRLKFVLSNPSDNSELATYDTGDIPFDSAFIGDNMCWKQSVEWRLVGMNFTVPVGVESIQLSIYNNVSNSNGNDFAIDDIEIHLCMTPDTVKTDTLVCDTISRILWREKSFALADTLRDTVFSSCGFDSIYYILTIQTEHCEEPEPVLCTDGILLFREDFGGNDPNESRVSSMPVPGMSYTQSTYGMGSGTYMVTKSGYCNGDTTGWTIPGADLSAKRSQWYIQDDHTYPNDRTRGYFLEIDGSGGTQQFYQTEISGLCEGIELTFSAYVANVFTWFQYDWYTKNRGPVVSPCLKFVLTNPQTGQKLAEQNTQEIPFDNNLPAKTDWQYSSAWYLVGMNFTVPIGVDAIRLSIYNNVTNGNGNDFALDDIEIHLCMTPDTVVTDTILCDTISKIQWRGKTFAITDTLRDTLRSSCGFDSIYYMMRVETEHCEPPCPEIHYATRDTTVCDTLMPFTWHGLLFNKPGSQTILLKDEQGCDSIEIDYTLSTFHCEDFCLEGELLFREDFGGNDAGDSEISCAHVSGIANFYTNACQEVRKHPEYGMSTMNYVLTKKGQGNRQWHAQDDHTYPNDYTRGYFLEVDGYGGTIYKTTVNNLYEGMELTFSAYIANLHDSCVIANMRKNYGYTYPRFKFILKDAESNAELATYTTGNILPDITTPCVLAKSALWQLKGMKYVVPEGVSSIQMLINNDVASYDGNDFGIDDIEIRLCYMPAKKIVQDTIICDTIDNIVWRNKIYPLKNELRDTVYDSSGADSIYYILNVIMEHCCPEIQTIYMDSAVCDTLLPFLWMYRDTMLLFETIGVQEFIRPHAKWINCDGTNYVLRLDTFHCERLYPIIVNKYNWQLVCNNVALRRFFPDNKALAFQWYKNGEPIPGANEDDYAEQNELNGIFQLQIRLDAPVDNDDEYIWSNILEIGEVQAPEPIVKKVYHWWSLTIIRYQQGDRVWYEKKLR